MPVTYYKGQPDPYSAKIVDDKIYVRTEKKVVRLSYIIENWKTRGQNVWTFFLSSVISLFFLLSRRRSDIDRNTVSKGRLTQNSQPTNQIYRLQSFIICLFQAMSCSEFKD